MFVCPTATPIMLTRREERITALAILGSATSTSFTSPGRSMATDLPMPSAMKRAPASLSAICVVATYFSAAIAAEFSAVAAPSMRSARQAMRIGAFDIIPLVPVFLSWRRHRADTEANHVDGISLALVGIVGLAFAGVGDAAQRERQRAALARNSDKLRLGGRELQHRRLADDHFLPVLLLELLIDRQYANVAEDRLAAHEVAAGRLLHFAVMFGKNDVDMIVGQNEPACCAFRRNTDRDGAPAGRQDGGHET